ncbi:hypothetical protein MKX01_035461 [Papaver californicum]|nr:hypothetical protein MKX01_035461 [Papaver californicum]
MAPNHHSLINHPCHSKHPLSLLSSAPYPQGIFNCDACCRPDKGFCYHCKECSFDIHIHCASLPLSVNHNSHPHHPLSLTFQIPYPTKYFSCDICKNVGSKCWVYRCNSCGFDAHVNCATSVIGSTPIQRSVSVQQSQHMFQHQIPLPGHNQQTRQMLQNHNSFPGTTQARTKPAPTGYNFATNNQNPSYYSPNNHNNYPAFGAPAMGVPQVPNIQNQLGNNNNPSMGASMTQGFYEGVGQQAGQTFMQGMLGSSFGGGGDGESSSSSAASLLKLFLF